MQFGSSFNFYFLAYIGVSDSRYFNDPQIKASSFIYSVFYLE